MNKKIKLNKKRGKEKQQSLTVSGIKKLAYLIALVAGLFWIVFGLLDSASSSNIDGLFEGLTFGGLILLAMYVAHKTELAGGVLLIGEGVLFLMPIVIRPANTLGSMMLGLPLAISGALFVLNYNLSKSEK